MLLDRGMALSSDTVQFQVRCILGAQRFWFEQHGVSFTAEGVMGTMNVKTGTSNRAWLLISL